MQKFILENLLFCAPHQQTLLCVPHQLSYFYDAREFLKQAVANVKFYICIFLFNFYCFIWGLDFCCWFGLVCSSLVWYVVVWLGLFWFGVAWFGMVWFSLVWFGFIGFVVDLHFYLEKKNHPSLSSTLISVREILWLDFNILPSLSYYNLLLKHLK